MATPHIITLAFRTAAITVTVLFAAS